MFRKIWWERLIASNTKQFVVQLLKPVSLAGSKALLSLRSVETAESGARLIYWEAEIQSVYLVCLLGRAILLIITAFKELKRSGGLGGLCVGRLQK